VSKSWGYQCRTCDERSGSIYNHGQNILRGLAKAAPHIKAAFEADDSGYLEISALSDNGNAIFFLREHGGHDLELFSEYGDIEPLDVDPSVIFERQLQIFERAVSKYGEAIDILIGDIGPEKAEPILRAAIGRVDRIILRDCPSDQMRDRLAKHTVDTSLESTDA
jgi:hypothetical protein